MKMREMILPVVFVCLMTGILYATGEFKRIQGGQMKSATTDTTTAMFAVGDSVIFGNVDGYRTLQGYIIVQPALETDAGFGNSDSGYIWLYTSKPGFGRKLLAVDTNASLPISLTVTVPQATGDTLLMDNLYLLYRLTDTLNQRVANVKYPIYWDLKLK